MSHRPLEHKISIPNNYKLDDINASIQSGGKFIVFLYCISFGLVSFRRYSPAFLIENAKSLTNAKKKYNRISYLLGWWAIPYGPENSISCIKLNNKGGLDVTEDIMLNIKEESLESGAVLINKINTVFTHPDEEDLKMLQKAFGEKLEHNAQINELIVGYFLNPNFNEAPFYLVGIRTTGDFNKVQSQVEKAIRQIFFKQTDFEFVNLQDQDELVVKLILQGYRFF